MQRGTVVGGRLSTERCLIRPVVSQCGGAPAWLSSVALAGGPGAVRGQKCVPQGCGQHDWQLSRVCVPWKPADATSQGLWGAGIV